MSDSASPIGPDQTGLRAEIVRVTVQKRKVDPETGETTDAGTVVVETERGTD